VRIKGITIVECNACGKAKAKRQIRRAPRNNNTKGLEERLSINFHLYKA
jgi:Zn ribbon nucleic-acid-binding protein